MATVVRDRRDAGGWRRRVAAPRAVAACGGGRMGGRVPTLTEVVHDELGRSPGGPAVLPASRDRDGAAVVRGGRPPRRPAGGRGRPRRGRGRAPAAHPDHSGVRVSGAAGGAARGRAGAAGTAPGQRRRGRTGRSWPAGSGCSTGTAGWCVGCPRRSSADRPVMRRRCGAGPCSPAAGWAGPGIGSRCRSAPPIRWWRLALVGAARRLGVTARSGEAHGRWRVAVPDDAQVVALLDRIGAAAGARGWQQSAPPQPARRPPSAVGFDGANLQRAAAGGADRRRAGPRRPGRAG